MRSRSLVAACSGIVLFAWCSRPLTAQMPASPADPELAVVRLEACGDHAGAAAGWLDLAEIACRSDGGDGPQAAALAGYHAARALEQHRRAPAAADFAERLQRLSTSRLALTVPWLADHCLGLALDWRIATGHPATRELADQLGVLSQFWICGPFANERGAGHAQDLPPQHGFDPEATWPGKLRPVGWRLLPPAGPGGTIALSQILHPAAQSLCYVATAVLVQAEQLAVLELGTTGAYRVFVNGAEVAARDVERAFVRDQDAIATPLRGGTNLLVIKLGHQEGTDFQFAARLRALDGKPLGARADTALTTMAVAASMTPATIPVPDALPSLRAALQTSDPTGADQARLAWLLAARHVDGDRDRRDRALAEQALPRRPDDLDLRLLLARSRIRAAAHDADRDENARRLDYEAILAADPRHVTALVELGHLLLHETGLARDAERLARAALAVRPGHAVATSLLADVHAHDELPALARQLLIAAARAPEAPPHLLRRAATACRENNDPRGHLLLRQRIHDRTHALDDAIALADLLLDLGRRDDAVPLLQTAMANEPFAPRPRRMLADLAIAENRLADALRIWRDWLTISPDDDDAWRALAHIHALRAAAGEATGRQDQIEALRAALECNPNLRAEQRLLEFLASSDTPFYAGFQIDGDAALAADAGPPADAGQARDPLHWVLRQQVVAAHRNGTQSSYHHEIVRVLNVDGARQLARWSLPWYRGEQRARMLGCVVRKADGTVQRPPLRGARVPLDSLQPGDTVELQGRVDDIAPSFFGDYFGLVHEFGADDGSPVARSELVVIADPGREYGVRSANGAPAAAATTRADGTRVLQFAMHNLPRDLPEPRRPDRREFAPLVQITTMRDWDHFAGWWWNLIRNQLEVTPAMHAKITELTAGLTTTAQKVAAIYRFVSTDVRYEAWEFGVHGYKPYATSVIFERRHGDCKDKALLLCAMLGALGIPCQPVLIFADPLRTTDDLTLAMVQQFNHCIAWLPPHDGLPGRFLDGTAVWHPDDTLPDMDQGARVLIVDRGKAELRDVPWTTPAANTALHESVVELRPDGSATVLVQRTPTGNAAVELRSELATEPARAREQQERQLLTLFGKATLTDLQASDPQRLDEPVRLQVRATLTELGQRLATSWELPSVFGGDSRQELTTEPTRHQPLLLGIPERDVRIVRYRLPSGWRPRELPATATATTPFGSFTLTWRHDGDQVVIERTVDFVQPRIGAEAYPEFRAFVAALADADARRVVLTREDVR
ncbi:MAG: DUF3857 domain-containing protein [Planctomycetes bacterium]|nr:DUF3857 domain-containing protein [Planctomycetota bacterium]